VVQSGEIHIVHQGPHWYAVQTKPRAEDKSLAFLEKKGVSTFLPRLLVNHRHGSRRWQVAEPLFPGYLFARFVAEPGILTAIRWTPGIKQVLWDGTDPTPVPDDVVAYLQERAGESGVIIPGPRFTPGMRVRVTSGPLVHLEGIIEHPTPRRDRVRVLLELLNQKVSVEVDVESVEPL